MPLRHVWPLIVVALAVGCACGARAATPDAPSATRPVVIGSKAFPESNIVAEIATQLARAEGVNVRHRESLGSTQVVWKALLAGEIDLYPDYTGTIAQEILRDDTLRDNTALRAALAERGVAMSRPLGFTNPYALGMREDRAAALGIRAIGDLSDHPDLKFTFSTEFVQRSDGWPSLRQAYRLPQRDVKLMEHALAYRAVQGGEADVTDVYLTDAIIDHYGFRVLEDDLGHFPPYAGVLVYRADLPARAPAMAAVIERLAGALSTEAIRRGNARVQLDRRTASAAAAELLADEWGVASTARDPRLARKLGRYTLEHLWLVAIALWAGIAVAVPLGVVAAQRPRLAPLILSTAEVLQTIPGLALLVLLMPVVRAVGLPGTGSAPVILALFLYSLLPIIRNTYAGMCEIPHTLRESAQVLGLTPAAILWRIELPMASRMILAGIKTTAVMTVGFATLGGLIGAGGYGQLISAGLTQDNLALMMEGAIPAALLALAVKLLFEGAERWIVPRGLRVQAGE